MSAAPVDPTPPPAAPPPQAPGEAPGEERDFWPRLLIGGLGALTPVVAQLLLVDLEGVFAAATWPAALGYAVRVVALFAVGMVAVFLDSSTFNRLRLFQLGMAAPSLLLAVMNGAQVAHDAQRPALPPVTVTLPETHAAPGEAGCADAGIVWPVRSMHDFARMAEARAAEERRHAQLAEEAAREARLMLVPDASFVDELARGVRAQGAAGSDR